MKFTMGGREFDLTPEQVRERMRGVPAEPIRTHRVVIDGTTFPPKQVIDACLGFPRTSFTTMEAQRVLNRLGFRGPGTPGGDRRPSPSEPPQDSPGTTEVLRELTATLKTVQVAIAGLSDRVAELESSR